jgi:hypothetical protein
VVAVVIGNLNKSTVSLSPENPVLVGIHINLILDT